MQHDTDLETSQPDEVQLFCYCQGPKKGEMVDVLQVSVVSHKMLKIRLLTQM